MEGEPAQSGCPASQPLQLSEASGRCPGRGGDRRAPGGAADRQRVQQLPGQPRPGHVAARRPGPLGAAHGGSDRPGEGDPAGDPGGGTARQLAGVGDGRRHAVAAVVRPGQRDAGGPRRGSGAAPAPGARSGGRRDRAGTRRGRDPGGGGPHAGAEVRRRQLVGRRVPPVRAARKPAAGLSAGDKQIPMLIQFTDEQESLEVLRNIAVHSQDGKEQTVARSPGSARGRDGSPGRIAGRR